MAVALSPIPKLIQKCKKSEGGKNYFEQGGKKEHVGLRDPFDHLAEILLQKREVNTDAIYFGFYHFPGVLDRPEDGVMSP
ncbi:hypothetical protein NDU88_001902 [Pleurodeles waltl]|uniref:Uncharacterized protein n=1 Tax=Pleurodeles waltl TaxID=8319 RepID=A0AAV7TK36_PLEWA|nr:hypothetical protein NDU88_001902 [Pleurodeles waltl]